MVEWEKEGRACCRVYASLRGGCCRLLSAVVRAVVGAVVKAADQLLLRMFRGLSPRLVDAKARCCQGSLLLRLTVVKANRDRGQGSSLVAASRPEAQGAGRDANGPRPKASQAGNGLGPAVIPKAAGSRPSTKGGCDDGSRPSKAAGTRRGPPATPKASRRVQASGRPPCRKASGTGGGDAQSRGRRRPWPRC